MKPWKPTPGYVCACLVCVRKAEVRSARRAMAKQRQESAQRAAVVLHEQVKKLEKELVQAYSVEELAALQVGKRVIERASRHRDATWKSQDGLQTPVQRMSQAHLLYALAKGHRGEYAQRSWAADKFEALESELLRRLAGVAGTDRQRAAHEREAVERQARTAAGY